MGNFFNEPPIARLTTKDGNDKCFDFDKLIHELEQQLNSQNLNK